MSCCSSNVFVQATLHVWDSLFNFWAPSFTFCPLQGMRRNSKSCISLNLARAINRNIKNKRNPLFYCCSRIRFQIPVFELCKIWIKKLNNYSTTEWFSAKRHKVKHRKSWKLLNWDQLQSDFPSLWMGISSWEVHNIIGKGQTNLPTWAKLILSQPFAQTPGRTKKRQL